MRLTSPRQRQRNATHSWECREVPQVHGKEFYKPEVTMPLAVGNVASLKWA